MFPEVNVSFGIIAWGGGRTFGAGAECIVCHQTVSTAALTAGTTFRNGACALACSRHMQDARQWMVAWVRFKIAQKAEASSDCTTGSIGA